MRWFTSALLLLTSSSISTVTANSNSKSKPTKPCTLHSPTSGSYFDLTRLQLAPPDDPKKSISSSPSQRTESWHARGHDYGANFTLNFCGPVIEDLKDVEGVDKKLWQNVSAYYETEKGDLYSIGQNSASPLFRGRKLVLNYTDGSPCPDFEDVDTSPKAEHRKRKSKHHDEDDDDDDDDDRRPPKKKSSKRRKTTIIPFWHFSLDTIVSCFWFVRLENADIGYWQDMITILFSSCTRHMPSFNRAFNSGGYHRVGTGPSSGGRERGRTPDDENRLIDQLDEEWDE
ncbi:MAG: hypothetical protein Q9160_006072 [Pyrenula sp. 1 TL-2023]